jgi:hypothetical protein
MVVHGTSADASVPAALDPGSLQVVADYTHVSAVPAAGRAGQGRASGPQYPGLGIA